MSVAVLVAACAGADPTYVATGGGGVGGASGGGGSGGDCVPASCPAVDNATPICDGNACGYECSAPFLDCNAAAGDGCEADPASDAANCGSCDNPCALGCFEGTCNGPVGISVGLDNACAVMRDGAVWCWGRNAFGEHGDGTTDQHDAPVQVPLPGPAVQVSVGGKVGTGHVCAAMVDGTVQCWGDGRINGNPNVDDMPSAPAAVAGLVNVVQVSAGGRHVCARQDDGDVFCWGANFNGELGNGEVLNGYEDDGAIQVLSGAFDVSAGDDHSCAVNSISEVLCWGNNTYAQLGTGDGQPSSVPVVVLSGASKVAAGTRSSCALVGSEVWCWGRDLNGAVGEGTCQSLVQTPTLLTVAEPVSIEVGSESAAAVAGADAHVVAWGQGPNPDGSPVTNPPTTCLLPEVKAFDGVSVYALGVGVGCAVMQTGTAMCWGNDQFGAVGDGPGGGNKPTAVEVAFPSVL